MTTRLILVLGCAALLGLAQENSATGKNSGCRVTGFVVSIRPETNSQPAENQFRLQVVDSPWDWQIGTEMPVTSATPPGVAPGDAVEVSCDFARSTRKGRFWGTASKLEKLPMPAVTRGPVT